MSKEPGALQGFVFKGERIPLVNPRRGIFKPQQMRYLLSIKTVFPRPGARVWYDDQRDVHRQIFGGDETVDYAFMRQDPEAADNRWLREAFENKIPVIYGAYIVDAKAGTPYIRLKGRRPWLTKHQESTIERECP